MWVFDCQSTKKLYLVSKNLCLASENLDLVSENLYLVSENLYFVSESLYLVAKHLCFAYERIEIIELAYGGGGQLVVPTTLMLPAAFACGRPWLRLC